MNSQEPGTKKTADIGAEADVQAVARAQQGDARAFEELVRRHERRVYRTALAITGSSEDAEEAMQETFIEAFQHLPGFRGDSRFATWLTRIAINESLQVRRRRRNTVSLNDEEKAQSLRLPTRVEDWYADPEQRYARKELASILEEAINRLPQSYRVVLMLRDVEGLSTAEAADVLGLEIANLKSRLLRARLALREELAPKLARKATIKSLMMRGMLRVHDALTTRKAAAGGKESP